MATQSTELLKHFKRGIWISQIKAFNLVGTTRLSALIFNYKKEGYSFEERRLKGKTRYGNPFSIKEYRLKKSK